MTPSLPLTTSKWLRKASSAVDGQPRRGTKNPILQSEDSPEPALHVPDEQKASFERGLDVINELQRTLATGRPFVRCILARACAAKVPTLQSPLEGIADEHRIFIVRLLTPQPGDCLA
jgi:hypothetical protein